MCRLLQIIWHLYRQRTSCTQETHQPREKPVVVRKPLHDGIGVEKIGIPLRLPHINVGNREFAARQSLLCLGGHIRRRIDPKDFSMWIPLYNQFGGIARAAAEVHRKFHILIGNGG